ncbi:MAG: AmmeMemoRadiSam system protein B [bacterium]|nr:AmmeMemoRadiSam system protein B [bacterium]
MKLCILTLLLLVAGMVWAETRQPAAAGSFYPGRKENLVATLDDLLEGLPKGEGKAVALVVPHAGYYYSGKPAAKAFAQLEGRLIKRVILIGPSHHAYYSGAAIPDPSVTHFTTPLGEVELDSVILKLFAKHPDFDGPARAHEPEHSLEVEIPFIQRVAPDALLVPILIGPSTDRAAARRVAQVLSAATDEGTVIVASTDFSHHGQGFSWAPFEGSDSLAEDLTDLAHATARCAEKHDPDGFWHQVEVSGDTVCGMRPVAVLLEILKHGFTGNGEILEVTTSGHVSGTWDRSVSYVSIAMNGSWSKWQDDSVGEPLEELSHESGLALLKLARAALNTKIRHDGSLAEWFSENPSDTRPTELAGAFVTVHNTGEKITTHGRLRACMGVIEARQSAVDAVIQAAVSASRDPRFPKLTDEELNHAHVEISILSAPREILDHDEIEVGKHGVILSKRGKSAVFLPQVATEQGWDKPTMLAHLEKKAGLRAGEWKQGARFEVFTAQIFAEVE